MHFFSTNHTAPKASFEQAVTQGLAPDKGLYFPEAIPQLPESYFETLSSKTLAEIGTEVALPFVQGEMDKTEIGTIVEEAMSFEIPLVEVENGIYCLELFHGPTLAFKDVGARFMSRCLRHFNRDRRLTVLVATSGDTGSAVANGFLGVEGIDVVILYPKGKVSEIQEKQLTTLGQNVTALEIEGTFDDCQRMVKQAFMDDNLQRERPLTSANSINIARLLPQSFYYHHAVAQLSRQGLGDGNIFVSVPSGNYGNIYGGLLAKSMGLPVTQFIASTNVNAIVPNYLTSGEYKPQPSIATISNAMDVGAPSNFDRIMQLFDRSLEKTREHLAGYSYSDDETRACIQEVHQRTGYMLDPHGAVGYMGLKEHLKTKAGVGVFLGTAHPAKFKDIVDGSLNMDIPIPQPLQDCMAKEKQSLVLPNNYEALLQYLLQGVEA